MNSPTVFLGNFCALILVAPQVIIHDLVFPNVPAPTASVEFDDIFPKDTQLLRIRYIKLLDDHFEHLQINTVKATDASANEEKVGVVIFSPSLS